MAVIVRLPGKNAAKWRKMKNENGNIVVFDWPRGRGKALPVVAKATACDTPCVAVVDADPLARWAMNDVLDGNSDFCCAGCFATATEALMHIPRVRPQLVTMDIRLPDGNGIECTKRLKEMLPEMKIVIVTGVHDANWIEQSSQAGADAYLTKPVTADQFLATLKFAAAERGPQLKPDPAPPTSLSTASSPICLLTPREQQVMKLLVRGLLDKEIAHELGICCGTVHNYVRSAFAKLGVANRTEAAIKLLGVNVT